MTPPPGTGAADVRGHLPGPALAYVSPMPRSSFLMVLFAVATLSRPVRADCSPTPASCFCETAAAVVDGHVEAAGVAVEVRIDELTRKTADSVPGLAVGDLLAVDQVVYTSVAVGDRVLFGLDANGGIAGSLFVVSQNETAVCEVSGGHEASVSDATSWLLAERSACHAALESRGWMGRCNDTPGPSCSVAAPGERGGSGVVALLALSVLGLVVARRRS